MIAILPRRVNLLADKLSKILLISHFLNKVRIKSRLIFQSRKPHSQGEDLLVCQVIGLLEGKVRRILEAPIQRASVFS